MFSFPKARRNGRNRYSFEIECETGDEGDDDVDDDGSLVSAAITGGVAVDSEDDDLDSAGDIPPSETSGPEFSSTFSSIDFEAAPWKNAAPRVVEPHSVESNDQDIELSTESKPTEGSVEDGASGTAALLFSHALLRENRTADDGPIRSPWNPNTLASTQGGTSRGTPSLSVASVLSREPALTRDMIRQQVVEAQRQNYKYQRFYPHWVFSRLVTPRNVQTVLREDFPTEDHAVIARMAEQICTKKSAGQNPQRRVFCLKRIFVVLLERNKTSHIVDFLANKIYDCCLPLEAGKRDGKTAADSILWRDPAKPTEKKRLLVPEWKDRLVEEFCEIQWKVLTPVLSYGKKRKDVYRYEFHRNTVLPYDKFDNIRSSNIIFKVQIDRQHHDLKKITVHEHGSRPSIEIRQQRPDYSGQFVCKILRGRAETMDGEVNILKKFSHHHHNHMISLLTTYTIGHQMHLLFDYAKYNLVEYWEKYSSPSKASGVADLETTQWISQQMLGLSDGLAMLHEYTTDYEKSGIKSRQPQFGIHSDIKAENILWFPGDPSNPAPNTGRLKLADFGLARFNLSATSSRQGEKFFTGTLPYRAPEADYKDRKNARGRSYDIWTLGIVFLLCGTWMLGGKKLVDRFSEKRRAADAGYPGCVTDAFFEHVAQNDPENCGAYNVGYSFKIKEAVKEHFESLRRHRSCTPFLHDLLDLIEKEMLIVLDDTRPARIEAARLCKILGQMSARCTADRSYACDPRPRVGMSGSKERLKETDE